MGEILVVEDDIGILTNISLLLTSEGYEVETAENGLEALKKIEKGQPDLILSDVMMPYLDGIELFKKVRNDFKLLDVPFIFLTAKSDYNSMRNTLGLGASDYIAKPFESDDLLHSIKVRLEQKEFLNKKFDELQKNFNKFVPHELRSPLLPILGYSEMLKNDSGSLNSVEVEEMAEKINCSGNRLLNRIEKFMSIHEINNLTLVEIEKLKDHFTEISNETINKVITHHYLLKNEVKKFDIKLEAKKINIKETCLLILLKEILENANKFNTSNKNIQIMGKVNDGKYLLSIKNEGCGMSKDQIANIGLLNQFDRTEINQEGNGLGLAIVRKIAKVFNCEFSIKSEPNIYTQINLSFDVL